MIVFQFIVMNDKFLAGANFLNLVIYGVYAFGNAVRTAPMTNQFWAVPFWRSWVMAEDVVSCFIFWPASFVVVQGISSKLVSIHMLSSKLK